MLLLLVTGQRGQTIHLLDLNNMSECNDSYIFTITEHLKQSRPGNLIPVITLRAYHNDKSLCVYTHLKKTTSRWVKISLESAGIDTMRFKPRSTRQAYTLAAKQNAVSL